MANQQGRRDWTPKKIAAIKKAFAASYTVDGAVAAVSVALGERFSYDTLQAVFRRRGEPSPATFLRKRITTVKPEDLAAQRLRDDEASQAHKRQRQEGDALARELRELRARQAWLDELAARRAPPAIAPRERSGKIREMTAVVLASDWHVEEPVDPEAVAYRNEYNLDIAARRVERFFQSIVWNIEHQRASKRIAIRDLVLWLGGDLMSGYIHEELVESNLLSPTETVRWLLPRLRDGIATLQSHLDLARIVIPCSFGNHGRTTTKPRISTGYANSFEWLMYHSLADEFRANKAISFEITNSAHQYVQIYDWTAHFHHGDDLKYQGGVGGLGIPLLKAIPSWSLVKAADVHCIGHWHQLRDYGSVVVNGSLIGFGPYSQRIRASFEEPQQAMFYMDSVRGKTMLTSLWVGEEAPQHAAMGR